METIPDFVQDALPTLKTSRLILRPFVLSDAKAVQQMAGLREISSVTANVPYPYLDGMAEAWIGGHAEAYEKGAAINLAVDLKSDKKLIGCVSLMGLSSASIKAELGYWIGVDYWNKGYCSEACQELIDFAFKKFQLNKITSRHMKINPASGKVMQKIGMKHEGTLRQEMLKDGVFHDMEVYGLLSSD